jgi:hypothetical protein
VQERFEGHSDCLHQAANEGALLIGGKIVVELLSEAGGIGKQSISNNKG